MQFGADVNAYTSYDETVFELTVPLSHQTMSAPASTCCANGYRRQPSTRIRSTGEKGVVLDEWRQSDQTFEGRVGNASEAMLLTGSGYEDRQPIGTDTAIKAMTPELLRRFYDTWYRPRQRGDHGRRRHQRR